MCSYNQIQKLKLKICVFFVVPGNGQALLRMPDTTVLNIINLNIDSIQAEITKCKNKQRTGNTCCFGGLYRDTEVINKQDANGQNDQNKSNKSINYFHSSKDTDADKRKNSALTQKIHKTFDNILMVLGSLKAHSHYSINLTANHTKHCQGIWHMHYKNHSRRSWSACKEWTSSHPLE